MPKRKNFAECILACKVGDVVELTFVDIQGPNTRWIPSEENNGTFLVTENTDEYIVALALDDEAEDYHIKPEASWMGTCKKLGRARIVDDVHGGDSMFCWNKKAYVGFEIFEGKKLLAMFRAVGHTLDYNVD